MISVLFIDNDDAHCEIGKYFLEKTGDFTVDTLGLAKKALALENLATYDAIVSDYQMPGMDGIGLLTQIRATGSTVPFILFTGKGREEVVIRALDGGADFYVMKGGDPTAQFAELAHKIRIAVQRQRDRKRIEAGERTLRALFRSLVGTTGIEALKKITVNISTWLGVDCVMVGEIRPDRRSVSVLAMHLDGRDVENFSYELKDTPCENVREKGFCIYPDKAKELFPHAKDLAELAIRGYAGTPLRDSAGETIGILCLLSRRPLDSDLVTAEVMDIFAAKASVEIERRRSEEALSASEEKYRSLTDAAEDFIYIIDRDDTIVHMNRFGLEKLKKRREDVIGKPRKDVFPSSVADPQDEKIREVFQAGKSVRFEAAVRVPDHTIWEDIRMVPIRSGSGTITEVLGISRDITAHKDTENALRENLERQDLILKNANEGILINEITPRGPGRFIMANDSVCRISGLTREELKGVSLIDLDTPGMQKRAPGLMQELMKARHVTFQTPYVTKDNAMKILEISSSLFELSGRTTMLSVVRDITEQKRAEQALQHANKKLNLLTGITRHDIRNQLLSLNAYLVLSKETPGIPQQVADFIEKQEAIAKTIERQILFTKEYENLGVAAPQWQNVEQGIGTAARQLDLTGVTLEAQAMGRVEVLADSLLQKVFFNLADNSLRHGGESLTRIWFWYRETENGLVIVYEDDGVGIPGDEKEMIFDRGYGKNSGFGLFFIREILAITGITIGECGVPGEGARFEITVPKGEFRIIQEQE